VGGPWRRSSSSMSLVRPPIPAKRALGGGSTQTTAGVALCYNPLHTDYVPTEAHLLSPCRLIVRARPQVLGPGRDTGLSRVRYWSATR
jgi:hypothetical protein